MYVLRVWCLLLFVLFPFTTLFRSFFSRLERSQPAAPLQFENPEGPPDCSWLLGAQSPGLVRQGGGRHRGGVRGRKQGWQSTGLHSSKLGTWYAEHFVENVRVWGFL